MKYEFSASSPILVSDHGTLVRAAFDCIIYVYTAPLSHGQIILHTTANFAYWTTGALIPNGF